MTRALTAHLQFWLFLVVLDYKDYIHCMYIKYFIQFSIIAEFINFQNQNNRITFQGEMNAEQEVISHLQTWRINYRQKQKCFC